jgi:hypothetical protein
MPAMTISAEDMRKGLETLADAAAAVVGEPVVWRSVA